MNSKLPKILYDQTQFTPIWMFDAHGLYLSDAAYKGMREISGYAPEDWITYTQNKPESFWFGAYPEKTLEECARIGFATFTDPHFLEKFEQASQEAYRQSKELSVEFFSNFFMKEVDALRLQPTMVSGFLKKMQKTSEYIISYYMLTEPQRFYLFEEKMKPLLPNHDLEFVSNNGRHLTYVSRIREFIVDLAKTVHASGKSYETFIAHDDSWKKKMEEIISIYGFLNWNLFGGSLADAEYIKSEVEILLASKDKYAEEVKKMEELQSRIVQRNEIVEKNTSSEMRWADIMGHSSVLRFDLQTCMLVNLKYASLIFEAIQKEHDLPKDALTSYEVDEIITLVEQGVTVEPSVLEERQLGYLRIWKQEGVETITGQTARSAIKDLLEFRANEIKSTQELKGTTASWPNKSVKTVTGRAFVLTTAFDLSEEMLSEFKEGDILVATQTHPHIVPQMKKSGAVVTDEGGITCHAAIVSRELGKPCIIGTRLGSKIFKTGDTLELDLEKGTVKKIA